MNILENIYKDATDMEAAKRRLKKQIENKEYISDTFKKEFIPKTK